jgi:PDZ domain-containing protein
VPLAIVATLCPLGVVIAGILPSTVVDSKERCDQFRQVDGRTECALTVVEPVEFAVVPAAAQPVAPRLAVSGAEVFGGRGEVLFVTVRTPDLSALEWALLADNEAAEYLSYVDKYGKDTPQQQETRNAVSMRGAKESAEFVAFSKLGLDVELIPGEVIIDDLVCLAADESGAECREWAPSDKVLDPGDKLLELDGMPLDTLDDLSEVLRAHKGGDVVSVKYDRNGVVSDDEIELLTAPDDPNRTIVGFYPFDTATVKLPDGIEVTIDTDAIGGPSAGLAFTLTLIDQLSDGDLLGGKSVAVTGAIDVNGNVGAIGGLASKAEAVRQMGADYFLVPTSQGEDDIATARRVAGDEVVIIPVGTIDEALVALEKLGGDPLVVD